ncbi:SUKH-4 family immunity protein [Streptomyces sp. NPDC058045]|uniref:SUKH-4 family immunity protein n=1 Tax=Streptomyces sp. NPDC058045 TaxID=3346311 RepID=UPI0036E3187A
MVTFAQAQERAEEWINGEVPGYQHRAVRVQEFGLGFVAWAEDREDGPRSEGGAQRLVIARDTGDASLWPGLPVDEVIRCYEEEYGGVPAAPEPPAQPERVDLNQTSFLLSPPEWLQEAADKMGIPDHRPEPAAPVAPAVPDAPEPPAPPAPEPVPSALSVPAPPESAVPPAPPAPPGPAEPEAPTPWAGTDTNADAGEDRSVPLPATVFSPPLVGADDDDTPPPSVTPEAKTALMSGGSQLPATTVSPALNTPSPQPPPPDAGYGYPAPQTPPAEGSYGYPAPQTPPAEGSYGYPAPQTPPPPPGENADGPATPPPSGGSGGGSYVPTQLVSSLGPDGPQPPAEPGAPKPPGATPPPSGGVHAAATMLADPSQGGGLKPPQPPGAPGAPHPPNPPGTPGTPPPPSAPGTPGTPSSGNVPYAATMLADPSQGGGIKPPQPPGAPGTPSTPPPPSAPGAPGTPPPGGSAGGGVHAAATMLAGPAAPPPPSGPGMPPPGPGMPPGPGGPPAGAGYPPQAPSGLPTVGPGYQAVLRYRAADGSEQQLIRRSAPGTPHPEWQILHELRAMNVPPQQVLELHTELESCELPGAYCARMIRETWPQARITSIAPYGKDHASRQQGMQQLLAHQGELHQVADGPARSAPVRAPLGQVQQAPPLPPDGVAQELAGAFGPGVFRFDQRAVSRQGVPEVVATTLMWAGLPVDLGPFFWAQAQPGRPVPTLAEMAQERGVQPASDAGSYLVMGSDFGRAICVQYGTANIVAVPVEAGPGGAPVPPQFVNSGLPEFVRCLALLGRMWRLRFGLNQEQAGRWTVDFQAQLAALDPAALASPEGWWSVILEQMWDGLL